MLRAVICLYEGLAKRIAPRNIARTSGPIANPKSQPSTGLSQCWIAASPTLMQTRIWNRNCEKRRFKTPLQGLLESRLAFWLRRGLGADIRACACNGIRSRSGLSLARRSLTQSNAAARRDRCRFSATPRQLKVEAAFSQTAIPAVIEAGGTAEASAVPRRPLPRRRRRSDQTLNEMIRTLPSLQPFLGHVFLSHEGRASMSCTAPPGMPFLHGLGGSAAVGRRRLLSMPEGRCTFCDIDGLPSSSVLFLENKLCVFGNLEAGELLRGSGVIVPKAHRPTVFDLTAAEIDATFSLLREARPLLDERYRPDGFNIGWNCYATGGQIVPHAHLHVLLRFADEPKAGAGIRRPLRQPENRRPDPAAPGRGDRSFGSISDTSD
jgi:diadenosine tetraphosphate (Ap4A) HIT family hydrolase